MIRLGSRGPATCYAARHDSAGTGRRDQRRKGEIAASMKSWVSLSGILQRTPERIPGSERRSPQGPTREEQTTITITWHCTEATATMQVDSLKPVWHLGRLR
jgi:hypothetical protein